MLRFYSARVGIAVRAFSKAVRLSGFAGSLWLVRFFMAIPTELRSRRRGGGAFLCKPKGLAMLSAGSMLGLKCGSRTAASLDSLHVVRGKAPLCQTSQ